MAKAKKPTDAVKPKAPHTMVVEAEGSKSRDEKMADLALTPGLRHAAIASGFAAELVGGAHELPIPARVGVVGEAMAKGRNGDKAIASEMLAAQAVVLDTMFTELANRAASNLGHYIDAADRYARLA